MAPCGDNGGIWRFILKHSISVHTNPLILEKWTKSWMTVHLLNYKISKVKYYVCEIKKAFYWGTEHCLKIYIENIAT